MPLAHAPGARDRDGTATRPQPMAVVSCSRSRRNKIDAETGSGEPVPTPVGGVEEWLALRDGRIALAEGPPGDITALDHEFWLHTEKFRFPQYDISDLARFERPDPAVDTVGACRVERVLGQVLQDARVVVRRLVAAQQLHLMGQLPRAADHLAYSPHPLRVGVDNADRPQVVQEAFGLHGGRTNALGDH